MVPEPDQLPANWPNGPALEADPWVARLCALPSPPTKNKIVSAKAAPRNIALTGFECRDIIEILGSFGDRPDNTLAMHWFPQRNNQSTVVVVIVTIELWIGLGRL